MLIDEVVSCNLQLCLIHMSRQSNFMLCEISLTNIIGALSSIPELWTVFGWYRIVLGILWVLSSPTASNQPTASLLLKAIFAELIFLCQQCNLRQVSIYPLTAVIMILLGCESSRVTPIGLCCIVLNCRISHQFSEITTIPLTQNHYYLTAFLSLPISTPIVGSVCHAKSFTHWLVYKLDCQIIP